MKQTIVAQRTRSDGDWRTKKHYTRYEIRYSVTNSLTSVQKDNLLIEIYEIPVKHKRMDFTLYNG